MNRQINHIDSLINRIDIDIEESIDKYNKEKEKVLRELKCFELGQRHVVKSQNRFSYKSFLKPVRYQTVDEWPESMKVSDYLNRIRERTINELRKNDQIQSTEKYYFQVVYKPEGWVFSLFTFLTDFYMSPTDINLLE